MKLPYLLLAMLLIVIAIIFIFSKLPKIKEGNTMEGVEYKGEKLIDFGVLKTFSPSLGSHCTILLQWWSDSH